MESNKVKKKSQLGDGPLRIDHSDVYFENDRLSEELGIVKDILLRYKHRQYLNRDDEIKELRKTLGTLEAMKKSAHHTQVQQRPKTTPAYLSRPQRPESTATQARVVKLNVHIPDEDSDSANSDDSSLIRSKEAVAKAKALMKPKVITKAGLMKAQLEHKKFPSSWYTDVLQPCDSVIKKRTPTPLSALGLGRSRSAGHQGKTRSKRTDTRPDDRPSARNEGADDEPRLVCTRSKSAVLSRRKLIQMTNLDHITDTEDTTEPVQALREMNRIQNDRLQIRVKMFLDSLEELKKKQEAARQARRFAVMYGTGAFSDPLEPVW